jgi:TrmH family RNA methyltransferase
MEITSAQNPRIKHLVKLRKRRTRDAEKQILIEGYRELNRAVENGTVPTDLYFCREFFLGENEGALIAKCEAGGAKVFDCTPDVFRKISYRDRPDGLLALAPWFSLAPDDLKLSDNPLVLVAESIEKPGNLGTMLRSADAAGVDALIVCRSNTDVFNPNVVRASVGTLFTVPLAVTDSTEEAYAWLRANGIRIIATTPDTETQYFNEDLSGPVALVVGSEQYGLEAASLEQADQRVRIPMNGQADSLNVAASATLVLYEALRQRA